MTREALEKIVKDAKINLNHYDYVIAYTNENYTKLYITFALSENCGGKRNYYCQHTIVKNVSAIQKKTPDTGLFVDDFETKGWCRISTIR